MTTYTLTQLLATLATYHQQGETLDVCWQTGDTFLVMLDEVWDQPNELTRYYQQFCCSPDLTLYFVLTQGQHQHFVRYRWSGSAEHMYLSECDFTAKSDFLLTQLKSLDVLEWEEVLLNLKLPKDRQ